MSIATWSSATGGTTASEIAATPGPTRPSPFIPDGDAAIPSTVAQAAIEQATVAQVRPRASAIPALITLGLAIPVHAAVIGGHALDIGATRELVGLALLWVLVAALLVLGGARGWMPRWAAYVCCVLLPLSGWATWRCLALVGSPADATPWALPLLAVLPVPLVLYALWAHFPSLHRALPPLPISLLAFAVALGLAAAPTALPPTALPSATPPVAARPVPPTEAAPMQTEAPPVRTDAPMAPRTEDRTTDISSRVTQLTPDSPLAAYLPFFAAGGEVRRDAIERGRLLDTRQAEAEALLRQGTGLNNGLAELSRLDLAPTPALCEGFAARLRQEAVRDRGGDGFWVVSDRIEPHLEMMNWLTGANCPLAGALQEVRETAAAYPSSPERERLLVALDAMLATRPGEPASDPALCMGGADVPPDRRIAGCTEILRVGRAGFGRLRTALVSRGNAFYATADYRRAIADYGAALEFPPGDPRVLVNRANAEDAAGDHDAALRDYDAALKLDPGSAMAFNNRGASAEARGEHDLALPDLDAAVRLDATYATAFANRGRARFFLGRYAAAAEDFATVLRLQPQDGHSALWRMLAARRAQPRGGAASEPARTDAPTWPWPLVSVLRGDRDIAWGEQAALMGADPRVQALQSCEAAFYLGEKRLLDGAALEARVLLQQAATGCPKLSVEGAAARAELVRMAAGAAK